VWWWLFVPFWPSLWPTTTITVTITPDAKSEKPLPVAEYLKLIKAGQD
jgi:hypothetical protein